MKIDPNRLLSLRRKQGLTRPQLAERSGRPKITVRTIQRLENEPEKSQKTRKDTLNRLAKALGVKPGVLTGELPLPESGKVPDSDPERVQIGAQTVPKVRLAYDLIKHRYGVSATEIINMAPLFFALLAERSLAWRREKLKEVKETKGRLEQIDGFWRGGLVSGSVVMDRGIEREGDSIAKADLFGKHLFSDIDATFIEEDDLFDPSTDNPFASYLRKLEDELDITGVVDVGSDRLRFGLPLKFPGYDICRDELDGIANGSTNAKRALEIGYVRLSEIPEELMAKDAGEERAKWLEERLPDTFKEKKLEELAEIQKKEIEDMITESKKDPKDDSKKLIKPDELLRKQHEQREELFRSNRYAEETARSASLDPEGDLEDPEETESQETNSEIEKGGDAQ